MVESSQLYALVHEETLVELTVLWEDAVPVMGLWEEGLGSERAAELEQVGELRQKVHLTTA